MIKQKRASGLVSQRGQAMVEFIVASLVLLPLFVLLPMIGKYQDISHSTMMASRYVAFDAMVRNDSVNSWKPEAQLAQEVRRRFFSNSSAPIKSDDTAGDFQANQNQLWVDPTGKEMISKFDRDITVSFGASNGSRHSDAFTHAHDHESFLGHSRYRLPARGVYNGNVTVALARLPSGISLFEPFDKIDIRISRGAAVLIDPWSGRSPSDVQSRLNSPFVNAGMLLEPIKPLIDVSVDALDGRLIFLPLEGRFLSTIRGPQLGRLQFWADVVQPDRLR